MTKLAAMFVLVLAAGVIGSDAAAMCGGGGMGVGHGGGSRGKKPESAFKKWELPASSSTASLDTSKFDSVSSQLDLNSDQAAKIQALKKQIQDDGSKLADSQNQSRKAYDLCKTEPAARAAAQSVATAMEACKAFDPNAKFESGLANILTLEQKQKYRELIAKA